MEDPRGALSDRLQTTHRQYIVVEKPFRRYPGDDVFPCLSQKPWLGVAYLLACYATGGGPPEKNPVGELIVVVGVEAVTRVREESERTSGLWWREKIGVDKIRPCRIGFMRRHWPWIGSCLNNWRPRHNRCVVAGWEGVKQKRLSACDREAVLRR